MFKTTNATALTDKLIAARQKYTKALNEVIDTVVERRQAIGATIVDLNAEDRELAKVQERAERG